MTDNALSEILILTDDVATVYSLRFAVAEHSIGVTWTNNFWVAMSFLSAQSFASLIVDMRVDTIEEKFVLHFVEEYERRSYGRKIFLACDTLSPALRRRIRERGHEMLDGTTQNTAGQLVMALGIAAP